MIFTLNFHEFVHTVYTYVPNSVVKISMMFAKYFEYYTIILREAVFSWTRCTSILMRMTLWVAKQNVTRNLLNALQVVRSISYTDEKFSFAFSRRPQFSRHLQSADHQRTQSSNKANSTTHACKGESFGLTATRAQRAALGCHRGETHRKTRQRGGNLWNYHADSTSGSIHLPSFGFGFGAECGKQSGAEDEIFRDRVGMGTKDMWKGLV